MQQANRSIGTCDIHFRYLSIQDKRERDMRVHSFCTVKHLPRSFDLLRTSVNQVVTNILHFVEYHESGHFKPSCCFGESPKAAASRRFLW